MKPGINHLVLIIVLGSFFSAGGTALAGSGGGIQDDSLRPPPGLPGASPQMDFGLLSGELQLSPASSEGDRFSVDIAYNSIDDEFLVVWHNVWGGGFRDIYARRVTSSGELQPWFCVATGADGGDGLNRLQPAVAFNSQRREYLVVYMVETSSLQYEIRGKTISWNGSGANAEFPIEAGMSSWTPKVAYNPTNDEYLVAYNFYNTTGGLPGTPYKIFWAIVINDEMISTRIGWIDTGSPDQVDVAYNSSKNGYVLTYVTSHPATTKNDIDLIHLGSSGGLLNPPGVIHIAATAKDENRPAIATDQRDLYSVSWDEEQSPDDHNLTGHWYSWATDIQKFYTFGTGALNPAFTTKSDVGFDKPGNFIYVYQNARSPAGFIILGFTGYTNGYEKFTKGITYDTRDCEAPAVAGGLRSFLVAYECDPSDANRHIYAKLFQRPAIYLPVVKR